MDHCYEISRYDNILHISFDGEFTRSCTSSFIDVMSEKIREEMIGFRCIIDLTQISGPYNWLELSLCIALTQMHIKATSKVAIIISDEVQLQVLLNAKERGKVCPAYKIFPSYLSAKEWVEE